MGGQSVNSWFDTYSFDPSVQTLYNIEQANQSYQRISKVIEFEKQFLNNDPSKIFIGGFSQGCCMALYIGLTYPGNNFGGVMGFSGYLFKEVSINHCFQKQQMPILLFHGLSDNLVPSNFSISTYQKILQNCVNAKFIKGIGVGHLMSAEAKMGIKEFLLKYSK